MPIFSPEQAQNEMNDLQILLHMYEVHAQLKFDNEEARKNVQELLRGEMNFAEQIAENLVCPKQALLLTVGKSAIIGAVFSGDEHGMNKPEETEIDPRSKLLFEQFMRFEGLPEAYVGTKNMELMVTLSYIAQSVYGDDGDLSLITSNETPAPSS